MSIWRFDVNRIARSDFLVVADELRKRDIKYTLRMVLWPWDLLTGSEGKENIGSEAAMAPLPGWIQQENDENAATARRADEGAQRRVQAAGFISERGIGYWDQLALALQFNAQGLSKLQGAELQGSVSKGATGPEHHLHIQVNRVSVKHGPELSRMNLWYQPGASRIRCWYQDQEQDDIQLIVSGKPEIGRDVLAIFGSNPPMTADQLGEYVIRLMASKVRAK